MRAGSVNPCSPDALRSALDWWALAGVDTLVANAPAPWLRPARQVARRPDAVAPARTERLAGLASRPAAALARQEVAPLPLLDSLAAWRAALVERHPNAVALDGEAAGGLLLLGDAPSLADVEASRPFAGEAGQLLDRMLEAIGCSRAGVLLSNLSFWPSHHPDGPALARPWIERLVALAAPRAVMTLGSAATLGLLGQGVALARARGRWHEASLGGVRLAVLPSFHPADLLRAPARKALAWADLLTLAARIDA